jgi:hypothetical protein
MNCHSRRRKKAGRENFDPSFFTAPIKKCRFNWAFFEFFYSRLIFNRLNFLGIYLVILNREMWMMRVARDGGRQARREQFAKK